ncbi:hypothetical protein ACINK0_16455 [Deinococcus sp. VB343]|uniref:Histidine phosphatase family protein n=1 Tax=Deinococcus sp. VB142 TaxID=3112952 RepID=A0AAU6Q740_9DEIO
MFSNSRRIRTLAVTAGFTLALLAACSPSAASTTATATPTTPAKNNQNSPKLVTATSKSLGNVNPSTPANLVRDLQKGGHVIVFRYTGAVYPQNPQDKAIAGAIDDGQRISEQSKKMMAALGQQYKKLKIPVDRVWSSEYYFVYQHALAAFGAPVTMNRDLTGSLAPFFRNQKLLETSLQGLRNRTVTPPPAGKNTILFTHQGKFDKAYGYYPDAGQTLIFKPDSTGTPRLIANLSYEQFMALK